MVFLAFIKDILVLRRRRGYCPKGSTKRLTNLQKKLSFSISPDLHEVIIGASLGKRYYSSSKPYRLSKFEQENLNLTPELKEILIGLSLGYLYISRQYNNAILRFEQGKIHEGYILHLYELFEEYCRSEPQYSDRKSDFRTNNVYTRITFQTRLLPCFNEFHQLYFKDGTKSYPFKYRRIINSSTFSLLGYGRRSKIKFRIFIMYSFLFIIRCRIINQSIEK